jgi:predicted membrane-bound spermidine synthase
MLWFFAFFLVSGFCGILYELVWLRLAMAQFGVTTALVSIFLSVFMGGLGVGSWAAGVFVRSYGNRVRFPPLRLYALTELLIGVSALAVPQELFWGHVILERISQRGTLSSGFFYVVSGTFLTLALVPWCACMGATIPLAMFAIRSDTRYEARRSFSFLYLANVLGAVAGAIIPLGFIELYGFHGTLHIGAILNASIAASALGLTFVSQRRALRTTSGQDEAATRGRYENGKGILVLLFTTGLATMGMEVIWIRLFTPYIGPLVYSFAMILVAYLSATFAGSQAYRFWSRRYLRESGLTWISLMVLGLLPLFTSDVRVPLNFVIRVFLGVVPFAGLIGFLTPMLVDRWSAGDPDRAGRAYGVNVLGCIVGPVVSGFLLLPWISEHVAMLLFVAPWFAMAVIRLRKGEFRLVQRLTAYGFIVIALGIFFLTQDFETQFPQREVLRDATATVIAMGKGMNKRLLVNGIGMTALTPVTKMMAHLTLASLDRPPRNVLVICFGMGTTVRSAVSWGIPVTAVELVPSVPKLFTYYHPDGAKVLASPLSHVVIDDGRRFLERSPQVFGAIIIDPPPPVQAAGSSLLYSEDFYAVAKRRLQPDGILQQWLPLADDVVLSSVARALNDSFSYVRVFHSVEGWGWHFLASERPIPARIATELVARMPEAAIKDMMQWGPAKTPEQQFDLLLSSEMTPQKLIELSPLTPALQDNRPINEYFLLRTRVDRLIPMIRNRTFLVR